MRITGRHVIEAVADHYGLTSEIILGDSRFYRISKPRQLAMHLMREVCPHLSFPGIGRVLSRDHTTILHGVRRIEGLLETDPDLAADRAAILDRMRLIHAVHSPSETVPSGGCVTPKAQALLEVRLVA